MPAQQTKPNADLDGLVSRLQTSLNWASRLRDDAELLPAERELIAGTLATITRWSADMAADVALATIR